MHNHAVVQEGSSGFAHACPATQPTSSKPGPPSAGDPAVYREIESLLDALDPLARRMCELRLGLNGHRRHDRPALELALGMSGRAFNKVVYRYRRQLAEAGRTAAIPAIHALLGDDWEQWPERAWAHTSHLESLGHRQVETALLLAIAGIPELRSDRLPAGYLDATGLDLSLSPTARQFRHREQTEAACRQRIDRIVSKTIWPTTTTPRQDLSEFSRQTRARADDTEQRRVPAQSEAWPSSPVGGPP